MIRQNYQGESREVWGRKEETADGNNFRFFSRAGTSTIGCTFDFSERVFKATYLHLIHHRDTAVSCRRSASALSRSMCLRRRGHLFPARHNSERRQRRRLLLPHPFLCASTKLCTEAVGSGTLDKRAFCCRCFFFEF